MAEPAQHVAVLVGPSCPRCDSHDLQGTSQDAPRQAGCADCSTQYRWYELPLDDSETPESVCPGCGMPHDETQTGRAYCEDCGPSDCAYCGATTLRWMLSENLASQTCEAGKVAA